MPLVGNLALPRLGFGLRVGLGARQAGVMIAMRDSDVLVIGAGIVGASVAHHLATAGAPVTVVDTEAPGRGVTAGSFAWIGSSGVRTGPAAALRSLAAAEYRRLESELPGLPVTWSGSLSWRTGDAPPVAGMGQQLLDAETVAALEPRLRQPPEWALWAAEDGAADPVGVTERMIDSARDHGARIELERSVSAIQRDASGHVAGVETGGGTISGRTVVLAAGVATAGLAATTGINVPVAASPATLFQFRGPAGLIRTLINNENFDLRQVSEDRLIAAADSADRTLAAVRRSFTDAGGVELLSAQVSGRPMPADGEPIIGPVAEVPGLYVAVMHAAVTLTPVVGRLVAEELIMGRPAELLAGCRLDRFSDARAGGRGVSAGSADQQS